MSADEDQEEEYPEWFLAWLKVMGYGDATTVVHIPYEAPEYDPFAQWGAKMGQYGYLMRSLAPLYAASVSRQWQAIPQYQELAAGYVMNAAYFASLGDPYRAYREAAHGAYYSYRATTGAPAGLISSTFKLASFAFPPGTGLGAVGVGWRALGWPFFGAYGQLGAAQAMAPFVSQMYQMYPEYTQALITGGATPSLWGLPPAYQAGFLQAYSYPTSAEAFGGGVAQWTVAQVGMWSALAGVQAKLAGESFRQAAQQTIIGTMGMSLFQAGLGISMPIIATRTARAISGLPEYFTPQEQQQAQLQFGAGIGLQIGGAAWQAWIAPRFAPPGPGLLGGVKVYGPGDLMWQWSMDLRTQGIRASLTGGRVPTGLAFGPLEAEKFAEVGLRMSWARAPGVAATDLSVDYLGLALKRPYTLESMEYWAAKSGRYWGAMGDYLQEVYGFRTGLSRGFGRATVYGPNDLMWDQGFGPEAGAISGRALPRGLAYGPLEAEKLGEAGLKIRLVPWVWQPSTLARGITVAGGVAGAYGLSTLLGGIGARYSPEAELVGNIVGGVGGYLGGSALTAAALRMLATRYGVPGLGKMAPMAVPELGLSALLGPLSVAAIAYQTYAMIEDPRAIVGRWTWALANPLIPMPPEMRYTTAGLAPPGQGIPMNVQAWETAQIQAWQAANPWTPMPPQMRYLGKGLPEYPPDVLDRYYKAGGVVVAPLERGFGTSVPYRDYTPRPSQWATGEVGAPGFGSWGWETQPWRLQYTSGGWYSLASGTSADVAQAQERAAMYPSSTRQQALREAGGAQWTDWLNYYNWLGLTGRGPAVGAAQPSTWLPSTYPLAPGFGGPTTLTPMFETTKLTGYHWLTTWQYAGAPTRAGVPSSWWPSTYPIVPGFGVTAPTGTPYPRSWKLAPSDFPSTRLDWASFYNVLVGGRETGPIQGWGGQGPLDVPGFGVMPAYEQYDYGGLGVSGWGRYPTYIPYDKPWYENKKYAVGARLWGMEEAGLTPVEQRAELVSQGYTPEQAEWYQTHQGQLGGRRGGGGRKRTYTTSNWWSERFPGIPYASYFPSEVWLALEREGWDIRTGELSQMPRQFYDYLVEKGWKPTVPAPTNWGWSGRWTGGQIENQEEWIAAHYGAYASAAMPEIEQMMSQAFRNAVEDAVMWLIPRGVGDGISDFLNSRWKEVG